MHQKHPLSTAPTKRAHPDEDAADGENPLLSSSTSFRSKTVEEKFEVNSSHTEEEAPSPPTRKNGGKIAQKAKSKAREGGLVSVFP